MADAEPRSFALPEQDGPIRFTRVAMHRKFEADEIGKTTIHVWIEATAQPTTENFESIEAAVEFILYADDERLGSCTARDLKFKDEEAVDVRADDGLHIDSHASVTRIEARIDATTTVRSKAELKLEPQ